MRTERVVRGRVAESWQRFDRVLRELVNHRLHVHPYQFIANAETRLEARVLGGEPMYRSICPYMYYFSLVFATLGLIATHGHAQSVPPNTPVCLTNTGSEGKLFAGLYGTVVSPVPYANIQTNNESLTIYPSIRSGLGAVAYPGEVRGVYSKGGPIENAAPKGTVTELQFIQDDGAVVHRCWVEVIEFDPDVHDLDTTTVGNCTLQQLDGFADLLNGHAQIFEISGELSEIASVPERIVKVSPLTTRIIKVLGQSKGRGNFVWMVKNNGITDIGGICPLEVKSANEVSIEQLLKETPVCLDVNGTPLALAVGDTATLSLSEFAPSIDHWAGALIQNDPPIMITTQMDIASRNEIDEFAIVAKSVGSVTLIRELEKRRRFDTCLVTVR